MADHKYIRKEMRNGKWVYIYDDPDATKSTAETSEPTFTKRPLVTKKPVTTKKPAAAYNLKDGRTVYAHAAAVQMDSEPGKKRIATPERRQVEPKKLDKPKKQIVPKEKTEVQKSEVSKSRLTGSRKLSEIKPSSSIVKTGETTVENLFERLKKRQMNTASYR